MITKEQAEQIKSLFNDALDYECSCYQNPDYPCSACRNWEKAEKYVDSLIERELDLLQSNNSAS